jgi:hypothetical protein
MTEDKELLEMAAKAAGIDLLAWNDGQECYSSGEGFITQINTIWNPLKDDGDALRLAVVLQLGISIPPTPDGRVDVVTFYGPVISIVEYPQNDDRNASVRRAIVRAAAEIGKAMQ